MTAQSVKSTGATDREVATRATVHESGGNGKVAHLSVAERAAQGKAARAEVPRGVHGEWSAPSGRRDPVELLGGAGGVAGAGVGADPVWPDAGLAVYVLPGRGVSDGGRSRAIAENAV